MAIRQSPLEAVVMRPDSQFWQGKRVLLTGHTGFKGAWLALWLQRLGAEVTGLALAPNTTPALFTLADIAQGMSSHCIDIRDAAAVAALVRATQPEIVLHLAAQALVRPSYAAPLATYATNVMGTAHVLDALRRLDCMRVALVITTDKVYRNHEWAYPYRETDPLGGHDPYSASKAAAELVTASYRDAFLRAQGVAVATARAGNVIGGGDWSVDRLLPDAVRAWEQGGTLHIRQPQATRPWQHVLEPLAAYLRLAQQLWQRPEYASAYNFGPLPHEAATVQQVVEQAALAYPQACIHYDAANDHSPHEAHWLALETAQARHKLGIKPRWPLATAVERTVAWYLAQQQGTDALALCHADIDHYLDLDSPP